MKAREQYHFWRDVDGAQADVPHVVVEHSPDGYEWGYHGSGPADLALNMVQQALVELGHNGETVSCYRGKCFLVAYRLHQDFKRDVVTRFPQEGSFTYPCNAVRSWVRLAVIREGIQPL